MKNELKLILLITIKNSITLGCFTILSIVFNKWWIILFTAIFWTVINFSTGEDNEK